MGRLRKIKARQIIVPDVSLSTVCVWDSQAEERRKIFCAYSTDMDVSVVQEALTIQFSRLLRLLESEISS